MTELASSLPGAAGKGTNVQVAVRCRPLSADERRAAHSSVITCDNETKTVRISCGPAAKKTVKSFVFDKVFGVYSRQDEIFDSVVRPIVDETLAGFNCTIFAYGQTGTGKTYTMEGDIHSEEEAGIIPRAVRTILQQLEAGGLEFTIRVSFLELYNEELQDLLNTSGEKRLKLCEDVKKGVVCQNLEEIAVLNADDIFDILQRGIQQRQTAATLCNKNSSRSHTIFTLKIMIKEYNVEGEEVVRHGQLNLVDLAGSECIGRSGAKNDRAREAGNINQSLLTLGRVITALVDHHVHIPYRDSKLTRLLQESLGGKAKTCIIATLSPSHSAVEETMSTLDYAYRARNIKNQPTINQKLTKKVIMKEYFAEIETLRTQLTLTREKNGVYLDPADFYAMETKISAYEGQLKECETALSGKSEEVKILKGENDDLNNRIAQIALQLEGTEAELLDTKQELHHCQGEVCRLFVELRVSESVVAEQQQTESLLLEQRQLLQDKLTMRESEISALLYKLSTLENAEKSRLTRTQQFSANLRQSHDAVASMMSTLQSDCDDRTEKTMAMMQQLMMAGRERCQAMNQALQLLYDDILAQQQGHLQATQAHLEQSESQVVAAASQTLLQLQDMSALWTEWLQSTEDIAQQTESNVIAQQSKLHQLQRSISDSLDNTQRQCDDAMTLQARDVEDLLQQMAQTGSRQQQAVQALIQQMAGQREQLAKSLAGQVQALQQYVMEVTTELLTSSTSALASAQQLDASAVLDMQTQLDASLQQCSLLRQRQASASEQQLRVLLTLQQGLTTEVEAKVGDLDRDLAQVGVLQAQQRQRIACQRTSTESSIAGLSEAAKSGGARQQERLRHASQLTKDSATAIAAALQSVLHETQQSHLSSADSVVAQGSAVQKQLQLLGQQTHDGLDVQQQGLSAASTHAVAYALEIATSATAVSGNTPRKLLPSERLSRVGTRAHDIIKREARSRVLSAAPTYDGIKELLCMAPDGNDNLQRQAAEEVDTDLIGDDKSPRGMVDEESLSVSSKDSSAADGENLQPTSHNILTLSQSTAGDEMAKIPLRSSRRQQVNPSGKPATRSRRAAVDLDVL